MVSGGRLSTSQSRRSSNFISISSIMLNLRQVAEELVLTDMTGLHLGAGPYQLIYSRHLPTEEMQEPVVWPRIFAVI